VRYQLEAIARNQALADEIGRKLPEFGTQAQRASIGAPAAGEGVNNFISTASADAHREAIVLRFGRPSLPIRNNSFDVPVADYWKARLFANRSKLDAAIVSVGRIEAPGLNTPYLGTGWMIAPGVIVTNRHVAIEFGRRGTGSRFTFRTTPIGASLGARIDFREEDIPTEAFEVSIADILYIAPDDTSRKAYPDIALVRLDRPAARPLPPPIPLFAGEAAARQAVAVIGYPAQDPWNPVADQLRIFGGRFDVKRLAPGEVMASLNSHTFTHDCSTLGGSSGSVVIDIESGAAVGLHFAGAYQEANYAVNSETLKETLSLGRRRSTGATVHPAPPAKPEPERKVKEVELGDRVGYQPDFLGTGAKRVPLPKLGQGLLADVVRRPEAAGLAEKERHLLVYEHYTVVMRASRRMAIYTAVNIDGATIDRIKRTSDPWAFDPRIDKSFQIGNSLYSNNDFDRGHLVRRLDPAWGSDPKRAELDTFFFTNCTPQIHSFNDVLWGDLEDYLLDNSDTLNFRACVFTGPRFASNDPEYRGVLIPTAYWKVAVMVRSNTNELTATAYLVSQSDLLTHVEFAYGQFKTYQLPVREVETMAGLTFGTLRKHDPFVPPEGTGFRELLGPEQIVV
jgi:endonuclease G, mitochondrial